MSETLFKFSVCSEMSYFYVITVVVSDDLLQAGALYVNVHLCVYIHTEVYMWGISFQFQSHGQSMYVKQ